MTFGQDIDSCISLAYTIELSSDFSKLFRSAESSTVAPAKPFSRTTRLQRDRPGTSSAQQVSNTPRSRCQFLRSKTATTLKVPNRKGHSSQKLPSRTLGSVCRSTAAVLQQSCDDELETAAVFCSTALPPANLNVSLKFAGRNEPVQAMIDTGSMGSFITASAAAQNILKVRTKRKVTALAFGDSLVTSGTTQRKIELNQRTYQVTFTVVKHLIADVILGLDVLRQHHSVRLELCGDQPETVKCAGINELVFPKMKIAPPTILCSI